MKSKAIIIFLSAVLICAVGFIGCSEDDDNGGGPTGPDYSNQIYPLAVGNWWIFDVESYANDQLVQSFTDTTVIDTSISYGGYTWFGSIETGEFYRNANDGVWLLDFSEGSSLEPDLAYKYPASAGDTWVIYSGEDTLTVTVESTSASLTLPAGQFNGCYYYKVVIPDEDVSEVSVWFKEGVGMLKQSAAGEQMGVQFHTDWLLKEYHLE